MDFVHKIFCEIKNISIVNKTSIEIQKIFPNYKFNKESIFLIETNKLSDCHIVYAYISNIFSQNNKSKIIGFFPKKIDFFSKIFFYFKKILNLDYIKIYKSFNTKHFLLPNYKLKNYEINEIKKIYEGLTDKADILNIKYNDILIGENLYDAYLRKYNLPTIDIKDKRLLKFFLEFLSLVKFWDNYFLKNNVAGVLISDTVYEFGIPGRVAFKYKKPVFMANTFRIHRLSEKNENIFDMKYFKDDFNKFSENKKKQKLDLGKTFLEKRFAEKNKNNIENKITNLPKSNFYKKIKSDTKFLKYNNKPNCIIAAHHFSDAPHGWGRLLFNDFYDWVDCIGQLSKQLDYNWYLRFHPLDFKSNLDIGKRLVKKYNKFEILPSDISNDHFIKNEKVDLVLTAFGTIGLDYAYFGIPVINASINNPHICYSFNSHPRNIDEFKYAVSNFKDLNLNYSKKNFYEYYYMRYLDNFCFFEDELYNFDKYTSQGYEAYIRWQKAHDNSRHAIVKDKITEFLNSNNYRMRDENLSIT